MSLTLEALESTGSLYEKVSLCAEEPINLGAYALFNCDQPPDEEREEVVLISHSKSFTSPDLVRSGPLGVGLGTNFHQVRCTLYQREGKNIGFRFPAISIPAKMPVVVYPGNYDRMMALHMMESQHLQKFFLFLYLWGGLFKDKELADLVLRAM